MCYSCICYSSGGESPRRELLHNIDPLYDLQGSRLYPDLYDTRVHAAIRKDNWKLLTGNPGEVLLILYIFLVFLKMGHPHI